MHLKLILMITLETIMKSAKSRLEEFVIFIVWFTYYLFIQTTEKTGIFYQNIY